MAFDSLEFQGMFIGNYNAFIYEDLSTIIVVEKYIQHDFSRYTKSVLYSG